MIIQERHGFKRDPKDGFFIIENDLAKAEAELHVWCESNKDKWVYISVSPKLKEGEDWRLISQWEIEVSHYPKKPFHIMLGWTLWQEGSEGLIEVPSGEDASKLLTTYAMLGHFWQEQHREKKETLPPKPKKKEPTNMEIAMRKAGLID